MRISHKARQQQVDEIILALGGNNNLASILGVVPSAISNWRRSGRFPSNTYFEMTAQLRNNRIIELSSEAPFYLWGMRRGQPE